MLITMLACLLACLFVCLFARPSDFFLQLYIRLCSILSKEPVNSLAEQNQPKTASTDTAVSSQVILLNT